MNYPKKNLRDVTYKEMYWRLKSSKGLLESSSSLYFRDMSIRLVLLTSMQIGVRPTLLLNSNFHDIFLDKDFTATDDSLKHKNLNETLVSEFVSHFEFLGYNSLVWPIYVNSKLKPINGKDLAKNIRDFLDKLNIKTTSKDEKEPIDVIAWFLVLFGRRVIDIYGNNKSTFAFLRRVLPKKTNNEISTFLGLEGSTEWQKIDYYDGLLLGIEPTNSI